MRIIHTADIHLDASFAATGMPAGFGNRRRQSLRDVLHEVLQRAVAWPADAVLIAGDLFDLDRVSRDTVAFLRREFASVQPVPIFIAPGNHDPYVSMSPYALEPWPDNVVIFRSPQWTAHELDERPLTVHGFAFDGLDISENPFGKLRVPLDGRIHVAVGHGSERGHQPPDKTSYAPFDAEEAAVDGLSYLALGHFHAYTPLDPVGTTRMCYSGAPEGHGFGEPGPHHYLEIEIDASGATVTPVVSSSVVYTAETLDCSQFSTTQEIVEALRALAHRTPASQIARVTLSGSCTDALIAGTSAVYDAVANLFEYLEIVDAMHPVDDYESLAREHTSLGAFVRALNEAIAQAEDDAERLVRERAREVGVAAYRGIDLPIRGLIRGNGR